MPKLEKIIRHIKSTNNFDKLKFGMPWDRIDCTDMVELDKLPKGVSLYKTEKQLIVEISGKAFATPNCIGYINCKDTFVEDLQRFSGIVFDEDYLLNTTPVFRVDVTKDVIVSDPCGCISVITELIKTKSKSMDRYKYKNLKYNDGLTIVYKTKNKTRSIAYHKGIELRRSCNKAFREIFTGEYLEQTNSMLRLELQLRDHEHMRDTFGLEAGKVPTIGALFDCKKNILAEYYEELLDEGSDEYETK